MGTLWTCPYCNRHCTLNNEDITSMENYNFISKEYGFYNSMIAIIVCPNPECRKQTISVAINKCDEKGFVKTHEEPIHH
jgi:hypothetical protein